MQLPNRLKTPPFLQKLKFVLDPVGYIEQASKQYPDIFTAEVVGFGDTIVVVNHPQAIQEIFTNNSHFAAESEVNRFMEPLVGKTSIFMLEGEKHRRRRKLVMPPFHGERMRTYAHLIYDITKNTLSLLPQNKPFFARTLGQKISLEVILQVVFGLHEGERYHNFMDLIPLMMDSFESPTTSMFMMFSFLQKDLGTWTPWGKFINIRQQIDELIYTEIAERRRVVEQERNDILSLLMSTRYEEGQLMTDQELRDELIGLLLAGHETTASTIAWALYWIHYLPEVKGKLLQELDSLGDFSDLIGISRLPYLTSVCHETLRINPITLFTLSRIVKEPVELQGYLLEPGTAVATSIYLTHHREDIYTQAKKFNPERFMKNQFSPYEFIPFGGGARSCIGQALALFTMKLELATILSEYQLDLINKQPERLERRGLTLAPASGVKMLIKGLRPRKES
ncbi:MAG: cytochrome P450 [Scytonematopsis contorta HA4267-MV1]|jgi:unspecific monooxygenase|nr:cytochrome P450 [Scytonematopsis contorta HA4267-MV1]